MNRAPRYLVLALVCGLLTNVPSSANERVREAPEYQVKSAFLFSFIRLVDWPLSAAAAARAPLHLCVLGESPIVGELQSRARTPVKGREVVVRRLPDDTDLRGCEVLFISEHVGGDLNAVMRTVPTAVLTVSEIDTSERVESVLNLVVEDRKVVFDVNVDAAKRARLWVSARLLGVARAVDGRKRRHD
jgi:uncharacterized protein DUF4154